MNDPESRPRHGRPRTRRQQRRLATGADPQTHEWTRVWQSVWQHTNIDLDFPFHEEEDDNDNDDRFTRQQQRELDGITRRMAVAHQAGSAARFRDAANSILSARTRRSRTTTPPPESQEELRAWNAFDKFSQLRGDVAAGRKRKSATASPAEPPAAEPERRLKRPRTRLRQENHHNIRTPRTESSASAHRRPRAAASPEGRSPPPDVSNAAAPSFLQSLLREVELQPGSSANTPPQHQDKDPLSITVPNRSDSASPLSSPSTSPPGSSLPSPRGRSMSPGGQTSRPSSPPPLSSRIEPVFPHTTQYSPTSPGPSHCNETDASPQLK